MSPTDVTAAREHRPPALSRGTNRAHPRYHSPISRLPAKCPTACLPALRLPEHSASAPPPYLIPPSSLHAAPRRPMTPRSVIAT